METEPVNQETVLIIADDAEFPRVVMTRWQAERTVPAFTLLTGRSEERRVGKECRL